MAASMSPLALALALVVLCCAGSHAQILPRFRLGALRCTSGAVPAPPTGLVATGVNGRIEITWDASPCATSYRAAVRRTDVTNINTLTFSVETTRAVVTNVANSRCGQGGARAPRAPDCLPAFPGLPRSAPSLLGPSAHLPPHPTTRSPYAISIVACNAAGCSPVTPTAAAHATPSGTVRPNMTPVFASN